MPTGKSARRKGLNFELSVMHKFREFYPACLTSRNESKRMDDAGVDLCGTGKFQVQCKNTEKAPNMHELLSSMPAGVNLVFHKRTRQGVTVTMMEDDFFMLLQSYVRNEK